MAAVNRAMPRFQEDHVHDPAMGEKMPVNFQFVALNDVHLHHAHQGSWMPGAIIAHADTRRGGFCYTFNRWR